MWRSPSIRAVLTGFLTIVIILTIIITSDRSVAAQSITGINAEINGLRSRIGRLERMVNRLNQGNSSARIRGSIPQRQSPNPSFVNPPQVNGQAIGRSDPMFERLATLLIELKEDVRNMDQRLTEIETRITQN